MFFEYFGEENAESCEKKLILEKLIVKNKEYLRIAPMYSPILFENNVNYFKIYGERKYVVQKEDSSLIEWDDGTQHNEVLQKYSKAKDNSPL